MLITISAAACQDLTETQTNTTDTTETNVVEDDTTDLRAYEDDIPEMDFDGESFRIVDFPTYTNAHGNLVEAEETGDIVNDSIFRANRAVEERFNLVFEEIIVPGYTDATNNLRKSVLAGDDAYDYVMMTDRDAFSMATEGKYYYSVDELPYVNLDKLYWDQTLRNSLSVNNKLYFTYGANMLSVYDFSCIMLFNKKISEELSLDNVYQLVKSGKWTISQMCEMAKTATFDLDGNDIMDKNDQYGISSRGDYFYAAFWVGDRIPLIEKDSDDFPYFNVPGNEKLFRLFETLHEISTSDFIWEGPQSDTNPAMEMFLNGKTLFFSSTTFTTLRLRGMEVDYGIIPYPTLNEKPAGEPYSTRAMGGFPIVIPATSDPIKGSAVMEALACQYQNNVISAYYENAVQVKATRDVESVEMIDMLLTNKFMDLGDAIWTTNVRDKYTVMFVSKKGDTAQSMTDSIVSQVDNVLQTAINALSE